MCGDKKRDFKVNWKLKVSKYLVQKHLKEDLALEFDNDNAMLKIKISKDTT